MLHATKEEVTIAKRPANREKPRATSRTPVSGPSTLGLELAPSDHLDVLAGRYQLTRQLGAGSSCDVYEAIDLARGERVALKRFRDDSLDALVSLKQEFRALANIHAPGLVQFYDLVVEGGTAFFTMELVNGVTVTEYARKAGSDATRAVLEQLANAIDELHAHGQLHRDLKPENILVTADGGVRVLDFGLAAARGPTAGTPVYMAPELFLGGAPSPASDWYSYGVVLYELFAGSVPAKGRDFSELLLRKQRRKFPPAREVNPETPPDLSDLAWGLLEPDPVKRLGRSALVSALRLEPERESEGRVRIELFGRAAERAEIAAGLADARAGRPTVVVIEGESGAGKSSLVRAFLVAECATGCFVMTSVARPQESVPLRAIDAIVDELASLIARLPAAERAALESRVAPELVRSFPVLGMLSVALTSDDRPGTEGSEVRREAQLAFAAVLRRLAEIQPVVLWIDDLQWADYESLLFLEAAVAHAGAGRLLVVLGRRSAALAWPDRETWLAGFRRIALGPLDEAAARALLGAHTARQPMTDGQIARMMQEAGGNAFLLEFLARHMRDREPGEALGEPASAAIGDIGAALGTTLDGLSRDARILFECVSLTQHAVPRACLGHVLADRAELSDHLARLLAEGLISVDERDHVRPYHDALREPAEAALDAATRSARHASLAEALGRSNAPVEWQIPHLEGSGQRAAAADASIAAGRAAAERYAYEIAAAYFEKALGFAELAPATRAEVLAALSHNLAATGNGGAAAERYEQAAEVYRSTSDPRTALTMHHRGAIALLRSGEIEAGRAALTRALRGLGERLPGMPLVALFYEALRLALRSRAPASLSLSPRLEMRLDTLWTSATTLSMYDPVVAYPLTLRFVRQALAAGEPRWVVRALALEAAFLSALGGRFRARAERT
ncbi:MAG TPA: protein kinase, partial [Kofleriaceae bacterium]